MNSFLKNLFITSLKSNQLKSIHTSASALAWSRTDNIPKSFLRHNQKIYPPQSPDEEPRPAVSYEFELDSFIEYITNKKSQSYSYFMLLCNKMDCTAN